MSGLNNSSVYHFMKFIKDYSTTTAILLFAQSENIESVSKPIACQKKQNVLLWKKMNGRVLKTIQKTNLPYFISDETGQTGTTFGEKLTHSIQELFNKGFEKVIVIGNDCPELKSSQLHDAALKLQVHDFVLGANFNGGSYLIGVTQSALNVQGFSSLAWQTSTVLNDLQVLFNNNTVAFLPNLNDCNSRSDFKKAVHNLSFLDGFKNLILSLLQNNTSISQYEISFFTTELTTLNFNKGSPFSF